MGAGTAVVVEELAGEAAGSGKKDAGELAVGVQGPVGAAAAVEDVDVARGLRQQGQRTLRSQRRQEIHLLTVHLLPAPLNPGHQLVHVVVVVARGLLGSHASRKPTASAWKPRN